jgi:hypothetical protein
MAGSLGCTPGRSGRAVSGRERVDAYALSDWAYLFPVGNGQASLARMLCPSGHAGLPAPGVGVVGVGGHVRCAHGLAYALLEGYLNSNFPGESDGTARFVGVGVRSALALLADGFGLQPPAGGDPRVQLVHGGWLNQKRPARSPRYLAQAATSRAL